MNPYPFVGLNNFSLPVAISISHRNPQDIRRARARQGTAYLPDSPAIAPTFGTAAYDRTSEGNLWKSPVGEKRALMVAKYLFHWQASLSEPGLSIRQPGG